MHVLSLIKTSRTPFAWTNDGIIVVGLSFVGAVVQVVATTFRMHSLQGLLTLKWLVFDDSYRGDWFCEGYAV